MQLKVTMIPIVVGVKVARVNQLLHSYLRLMKAPQMTLKLSSYFMGNPPLPP